MPARAVGAARRAGGVRDAIARSLARDPAHRTPTARAFADALAAGAAQRAAAPHDATVGDRSIVVLPFDNLSPDPTKCVTSMIWVARWPAPAHRSRTRSAMRAWRRSTSWRGWSNERRRK